MRCNRLVSGFLSPSGQELYPPLWLVDPPQSTESTWKTIVPVANMTDTATPVFNGHGLVW